ncbi:uncharacterized protein N7529_002727 [Penicillium soppii]|uniref:uncharacterized protein n=1 Tax=Penicillium soppii TaxID=69789 RepID=UPI002549A90E|nr:uncharacterized protein N7529_002727 [Penicillium soppii]KAJ5874297.1 hypothetical protein N7529_002727 [Penicillium soppii]
MAFERASVAPSAWYAAAASYSSRCTTKAGTECLDGNSMSAVFPFVARCMMTDFMSVEGITVMCQYGSTREIPSRIRPRKVPAALGTFEGFLLCMTSQVTFQMLWSSKGTATHGALNMPCTQFCAQFLPVLIIRLLAFDADLSGRNWILAIVFAREHDS